MERVKKHLKAIIATILLLIAMIVGVVTVPPIINPVIPPTGSSQVIRPSGDGLYHQLKPELSTNWQLVDDTGYGDGDTTYVYTHENVAYYPDLYDADDGFWLPEGYIIDNITIYIRTRSTSSTYPSSWYIGLKISGQDYWYYVGTQSSTSYELMSHTWTENPYTSEPWTEAQIDALEIGEKGKSGWHKFGTPEYWTGRCTQTYCVIEYSEADVTPPSYRNQDCDESVKKYVNNSLCAEGYDAGGLDYAILATNETGAWANKTTYGSPMDMEHVTVWTWSNFSWVNESMTIGSVVQWRIYYNDTSGNENVTGILDFEILPPSPEPSNRGKTDADTGNLPITFYCYWEAICGNLSHYIFEHNMTENGELTNETYAFPSDVSEAWSNITKTLPDGGGLIYWYFYANNTGNYWEKTETTVFWCWKRLPNVLERVAATTSGGSIWSGSFYYNGTDGGIPAIYIAYTNSATGGKWHIEVAAFNLNTEQWTESHTIYNYVSPNQHYNPAITILPNGSLCVVHCYYTVLKYWVGTQNCTSNDNLTEIVTSWNQYGEGSLNYCNGVTRIDYPMPINFNDETVIFGRINGGDTTGGGDWGIRRWEGTQWGTATQLIDFGEDCATYAYARKDENRVILSFSNRSASSKRDLYLIYSDNKGVDWKFENGTAITLPLNVSNGLADAKIKTVNHAITVGAPLLSEYGRPVVWYVQNGRHQIIEKVGLLGETGTWQNGTFKFENGTEITGTGGVYFTDPYYGRPAGWFTVDNANGKLGKIVRVRGCLNNFRVVWLDDDFDNVEISLGTHYICNIVDAPEAYEMLIRERYSYALTHDTIEGSQNKTETTRIYGVKLQANITCYLTGCTMYYNSTASTLVRWRAFIYNSTFDLISKGIIVYHQYSQTQVPSYVAWTPTSPLSAPLIEAGEYYWIFFQQQTSAGTGAARYYFYNESDSLYPNNFIFYNGTLAFEEDSYFTSLDPAKIIYYNRTVTIKAYPEYLYVRGLGRKFPSFLTEGWNQLTCWGEDVGHTLGEVNASLFLDDVNWVVIIIDYQNGTMWELIWDQVEDEYYGDPAHFVNSSSDILAIYCLEVGEWNHDYP